MASLILTFYLSFQNFIAYLDENTPETCFACMLCMFIGHHLYILKGDNMFVDEMSKNTPLTLGSPS